MPKSIQAIADEISAVLPDELSAWVDPNPMRDAILIGNDRLSFAITRAEIDDNLYMKIIAESVPHLLKALNWNPVFNPSDPADNANPFRTTP